MGEILVKYYKYIAAEQDLPGKVKLARETMIPSINAAIEPDSPENIAKFRKAIEQLTGKPAPKY